MVSITVRFQPQAPSRIKLGSAQAKAGASGKQGLLVGMYDTGL